MPLWGDEILSSIQLKDGTILRRKIMQVNVPRVGRRAEKNTPKSETLSMGKDQMDSVYYQLWVCGWIISFLGFVFSSAKTIWVVCACSPSYLGG